MQTKLLDQVRRPPLRLNACTKGGLTADLALLGEPGDPYAGIAADPTGRTAIDWGLYGVPETYVIAADGTVVLRFAGPITASILESTIRPAMAEAAAR